MASSSSAADAAAPSVAAAPPTTVAGDGVDPAIAALAGGYSALPPSLRQGFLGACEPPRMVAGIRFIVADFLVRKLALSPTASESADSPREEWDRLSQAVLAMQQVRRKPSGLLQNGGVASLRQELDALRSDFVTVRAPDDIKSILSVMRDLRSNEAARSLFDGIEVTVVKDILGQKV
ncbi:hypothetical protein HK405_003837 [Cladochytrium tenue]|nr:hypothetical protein HK405_003837 [Cladochytrium tenue]